MKQQGEAVGTFPTGVIWGVGIVLAATLAMAAASVKDRSGVVETLSEGASKVVQENTFTATDDRENKTIVIADADDGTVLEVVDRNSNGFIRGALRGLSRERDLRGIGSGEPFRVRLWEDGTLVLDDPSTGQVVALNGFGQDNARAFGKYLMTKTGEKS